MSAAFTRYTPGPDTTAPDRVGTGPGVKRIAGELDELQRVRGVSPGDNGGRLDAGEAQGDAEPVAPVSDG